MRKCRYGDKWTVYEYLDGTMLESRVIRFTRHLIECDECRLRMQDIRKLQGLLNEAGAGYRALSNSKKNY